MHWVGFRALYTCSLHRNRLSGAIPAAEWDGLDSLVWLSLYGNELSGGIPSELGNLSNLRRLYANNNDLSGGDSGCTGQAVQPNPPVPPSQPIERRDTGG